jgi:hypothetical protein
LSIDVEIFERERQVAVDMAITDFGRERVLGQGVGIVEPRAVEGVFAIFADKRARCRFKLWPAVAQIAFEGRKAVEAFVDRHIGRVLETGDAEKVSVAGCALDLGFPDRAIVEEAREIDIALLAVPLDIGDASEPEAGSCAPSGEIGLIIEVEAHTRGRVDRGLGLVQEALLRGSVHEAWSITQAYMPPTSVWPLSSAPATAVITEKSVTLYWIGHLYLK